MRLLVDTNIFLDIIFNRDNLVKTSSEFFKRSKLVNDELYVSVSTMKDIAYYLKKNLHDNNLVNRKLLAIYAKIKKVVSTTADDAITSLYEDGDYEDNIQRNSANRVMCDGIITRNIKDFAKKDINCWTPDEYLNFRI